MSAYRDPAGLFFTVDEWIQLGLEKGITLEQFKQAIAHLAPSEGGLDVHSSSNYFLSLADKDVPREHASTLVKYRRLATEWGVSITTPLCYRVSAGFTLKDHAPKNGPCYKNFSYLQDWNFSDEPTQEGVVFWIPRIVPGSVKKNVSKQMAHLAALRQRVELPAHHLASFGSVALLAGLILAHYKATGERVPFDRYWVRTDTCYAGGSRLGLGSFDEYGLSCDNWDWDGDAGGYLGVFALGVELGSSGT